MFKPIRQPAAGLQCPMRETERNTARAVARETAPPPQGAWLRALLHLFSDLACRLR
jgi:hypothetical protein